MHSLLSWLSQPQNSTTLLVIVTATSTILTAVYVMLTRSMAKAMASQTTAILQPVLSLDIQNVTINNGDVTGEITPCGTFGIKNVGSQPVVLLDVRFECFADGKSVKLDQHDGLEDYLLRPDDGVFMKFDFKKDIPSMLMWQGGYSYQLLVVASDLSHQVVAEYELLPVIGMKYCRLGMPFRVRSRRMRRWLRWKLSPLMRLFRRTKASLQTTAKPVGGNE